MMMSEKVKKLMVTDTFTLILKFDGQYCSKNIYMVIFAFSWQLHDHFCTKTLNFSLWNMIFNLIGKGPFIMLTNSIITLHFRINPLTKCILHYGMEGVGSVWMIRKRKKELRKGNKESFPYILESTSFLFLFYTFLSPQTFTSHHYLIYLYFPSLPLYIQLHFHFDYTLSVQPNGL